MTRETELLDQWLQNVTEEDLRDELVSMQDDEKAALAALVEAKKESDHPVLLENYAKLANGKAKQFSNAGFGDMWYALYLEDPKVKPQRQRPGRMY